MLTDGSNPLSNFHVAAHGVGMAMKGLFETGTTARYTNSIIALSDFKKRVGLGDIETNETRYYNELFELTRK